MRTFVFTLLSAMASFTALSDPGRELAPCPESPNCVSSLADKEDEVHYIEPFLLEGGVSFNDLRDIVLAEPRTELVEKGEGYLHVTFRTKWLRFVDDLELLVHASEEGRVDVRSASRKGYSDLGVNRKRVEDIRFKLDTAKHNP